MAETKRAILLNGPPGSGKDLSAVIIRNFLLGKFSTKKDFFRPELIKFADPLKAATHQLLCIPHGCEYYEKEFGNEWKNKEQIEFFNKTPRSEYIALSEEYAKKRHGDDVFGKLAARRIQLSKAANTFIFSDGGFPEEAEPIINYLGIDNVGLIELSRNDCSFDGDSRNYISSNLLPRYPKLKYMKIDNSGTQQLLTILLKGTLARFFGYQVEAF